jgi:hypothetical protein
MQRNPVTSSQIASVGYDATTKTLEIEFKSFNPQMTGSVYQYTDVPAEAHAALVGGESVGRVFKNQIKGVYDYKRVGEPQPILRPAPYVSRGAECEAKDSRIAELQSMLSAPARRGEKGDAQARIREHPLARCALPAH